MRRRIVETCVVGLLACTSLIGAPAALASTGPIHPGVQTYTVGGQCTANFIFRDGRGTYVGQAAHCAGTGTATDTDGCLSGSQPLNTDVTVTGAINPGKLVYSSWLAMKRRGETDASTCAYNDLALVRLSSDDVSRVDPSVPGFGGPVGVGGAGAGATIFSYGNSSLRQGLALLSPKQGLVLSVQGNGWSRNVYTVTPGIPGDSGSGYMNATGQAIGVLSTVSLLPLPLSNGVGDLSKEIAYARANGFPNLAIVNGTAPFKANLLGAILGG